MLHHPLIQELHGLRLRGMASALEHQCVTPDIAALTFEDRLGLLIQRERAERGRQRRNSVCGVGERADGFRIKARMAV